MIHLPASWKMLIKSYWRWFIPLPFILLWWFSIPSPLFNVGYSTAVYDRHGHLIGARTSPDQQWRFPAGDSIPNKFKECLIHFEDQYFEYHPGINPFSLWRALLRNFRTDKKRIGGSTLSMQVIRMSRQNPPRTHLEKITEIFRALRLEITHTKKEILSLYTTHAPFGGNVVGIEAAAWRYYGKKPELLTWSESATLAVLPNAPGLIFPGRNQEKLEAKRNRLLLKLYRENIIDSISFVLATQELLPLSPHALPDKAHHLTERIIEEGGAGQRHFLTLDCQVQEQAKSILQRHLEEYKANHIYNGAVIVSDLPTGDILAYVGNGSGNEKEKGYSVDIIRSARSPGSILKPLLYNAILEAGEILPSTLVPDVPVSFSGYSPKNFNNEFDGAVPAASAIARSLNVPAVSLLKKFGVGRFHFFLKNLGLSSLTNSPDHYGLSLILGGSESTLWDLASIYNRIGASLLTPKVNYEDLHFQETPTRGDERKYVPASSSSWFMLEAMSTLSRPEEELNWRYFSSTRKIAWKTGTSYGYRDGWAIGLTPGHLVGVWIGNASGEGRPGLTGIGTAAPVMLDVFRTLPSSGWFDTPIGDLTEARICLQSGARASEICPETRSKLIPIPGKKTSICSYHQLIHLDTTGQFQVSSECYSPSRQTHHAWFILPPAMEWYYKQKHPTYKSLPAWMPGCTGARGRIEIIYPSTDSQIFVPITIDGNLSEVIFEAAHAFPSSEIHWHLDREYLGSTRNQHKMPLNPSPGNHLLTLIDEQGNSLSRNFSVISR